MERSKSQELRTLSPSLFKKKNPIPSAYRSFSPFALGISASFGICPSTPSLYAYGHLRLQHSLVLFSYLAYCLSMHLHPYIQLEASKPTIPLSCRHVAKAQTLCASC
jgi:hypothetical protein